MTPPRRPTIACHAGGLAADGATIETLARLQLAARRLRLEMVLCHASRELQDLIAFCGLGDVLRVEVQGQPEEGEQRLRVEEEGELSDPPTG
jgi:hypothetical protein